MAERKVLVKYYPPEFDPSKLVKTTKPKNNQQQVRLMLPMSIQCKTCGEYISKGKKFNGRKEEVVGEVYLGIKIYRLYFRCIACLAEITFKTDPEHSDYTVERGASRNFEPWKQATLVEKLEAEKKEREEMGDNMKVLENRTEASKREMDLQDAIEEVKELNARAQGLTTDQLIGIHIGAAEQLEEEQIEALAAAAFAQKGSTTVAFNTSSGASTNATTTSNTSSSSAALPILKRLPDPIDFTRDDFRAPAGSIDLLANLEVPDSPNADGTDAQPDATSTSATGASGSAAVASAAAAAASAGSASPPAVAPLAAGLVMLKKRKPKDDDPEKEQRKKEKKKAKKLAEAANANGAATTPAATTGLGGLLGGYDDDSD